MYRVCGMVDIKDILHLIAVADFFSGYLSGPLQCSRRHITVNKMC